MMTRTISHYVPVEMFCLWLLEFVLSFVVIYAVFCSAIGPGVFLDGFHVQAAHRAAILALTIGATSVALGLYRPEVCVETRRLLMNSAVAGLLAFPTIVIVGRLLSIDLNDIVGPDRFWPLKTLLAWILSLFTTRLVFSQALRLKLFSKRVLVVGSCERASYIATAISARRANFYEVESSLSSDPVSLRSLRAGDLRTRRIWAIVVGREAASALYAEEVQACRRAGVPVFSDTDFCEQQLRRIDLETISPEFLSGAKGLGSGRIENALRRAGDIFISIALLLLTFPLLLMIGLVIKLDSSGPLLYRQERVGFHGRIFTLLKFRSMSVDAEAGRGPSWATMRDPRVTRVGSFIRLTRIDELPQLINVLRGEMSFIGPRPERPHFVETLLQVIPNYRDRSYVKPGLTGWAQVNFPYGASVEDARMKLSYDLYYVRHRSLFLDIMILFSTVRVILFQEGAR